MLKQDLLKLINEFTKETWKYEESDELDNDMEYIYSMEKEIKEADESSVKDLYEKLNALIEIIRLKHGYESVIIENSPPLDDLRRVLNETVLSEDGVIEKYCYAKTMYGNYINRISDLSFIQNSYTSVPGKEGLYLAVESLKSLITNEEYRKLLEGNQISEILTDCIKLNRGVSDIKVLETKYKELISKVWKQSLSSNVDNSKFSILFSNILGNGGNLIDRASEVLSRPGFASCSLLTSEFMATYGFNRRVGFIYPNDSEIVMSGAYDLSSNVLGEGIRNRDKETTLSTPEALEKIGKERAKEKGQDVYSSDCYSEVIVKGRPCGILVLGLGENDINIDYADAQELASKMNLPLSYIDTMNYKSELSEMDKYYISFHAVASYLGITANDLSNMTIANENSSFYRMVDSYKEQIAEMYLTLRRDRKLNKENMCQMIDESLDIKQVWEEIRKDSK